MFSAIFDLDGTLVDLFELHYQGFKNVIKREFALDFERSDLERYYGKSGEEITHAFFVRVGLDPVGYVEFAEKRRQWVIDNICDCRVLPGAIELLSSLRENDVDIALGTSNTPNIGNAILDCCGLRHFFKVLSFKQEGLSAKPAPDIFLAAATELGVSPVDCVVFEDSTFGVQAAKSASMKTVAVTSGTHAYNELGDAGADIVVTSLLDLDFNRVSLIFQ